MFGILLLGYIFYKSPFYSNLNKRSDADSGTVEVIVFNQSNSDVFIRRNISFQNTGHLDEVVSSSKRNDTLVILINDFDYLYISNKYSKPDTIVVGKNDMVTIKIDSSRNITTHFLRADNSIAAFEKELFKISQSDSIKKRDKFIDSLAATFFRVDYTASPLELEGDFDRMVLFPVIINREKIASDKVGLHILISSIINRYNYYAKNIEDNFNHIPKKLRQIALYKTKNDLFQNLSEINSYINSEEIKRIQRSELFINKLLPDNPFGKPILRSFITQTILKEKEPDRSRSRDYKNYFQAFNDCPKFLDSTLSKYARFLCFEEMSSYGESMVNMNLAFQDFKETYQDTVLNSILKKRYLFDLAKYNQEVDNVYLVNNQNKLLTLNDVFTRLKGKVIYIDFWASWCGPCRQAMPYSKRLGFDFSDEDLAVVYLSLDEDRDKWQRAAQIEGIDLLTNSYLIINAKKSAFLNGISLNEIPRYLLFNRKGDIIHQDAPGPSSTEIRKLIYQNL